MPEYSRRAIVDLFPIESGLLRCAIASLEVLEKLKYGERKRGISDADNVFHRNVN